MKKLTMICMAALLMIAASCKKDKKDEIENAGSGFRATVESHEGTGKTHLESDLSIKWDSGDAILVKSSTCTTPRGFTTQESGATVNFDADASLPTSFYAPPYTGYYPADKFSGDQLTLPATQQYDENNTFANGANPMAATSDVELLPFKNVCGVLKLQLYSTADCQVQSISITSNTGDKLCGTGTVTLTDGVPALGTLSNGGSTLTLAMGEGGKAMSTSESQPTAYYFVVPVGTLGTSFTVKVTETGGNVWTKTANATANLIARSQITEMPKQAVTTHTPVSPNTVTITTCVGCTFSVGGAVTVPSGNHTCEFGLVYSETDNTPTIEDGAQKIVAGTATFSGSKTFTADITGLTADITYYVRAYAMIEGVTYSTEVKTVTVGDVPQDMTWTGGRSPKLFTVASGKQVYFSQGNLQYLAQGGSGGNASATAASGVNVGGTWRFAEHQFDFIGADNKNAAYNYEGWIDLFGWGTSGYNHGAVCYQPWSTSRTPSHYYAYSTSTYTYHLYNQSGMADWGKANAISNGGSNSWRTLTKDEWIYLINSRTNAANLYGEGKVGPCSQGLIILPDGWVLPPDLTFTPDMDNGYETNVYTYSQWAKMEAAGAVFLPAAGYRDGTWVYDSKDYGYYWASSRVGEKLAFSHYFRSGYVNPDGGSFYNLGFSVRLVSNKK